MSKGPQSSPFDVEIGDVHGGPRLLLVSYHFPPAGTAGALRWQKLAGLAAERGWGLDVVSGHPSEAPVLDEARLQDLPEGTRIRFVRSRESTLERLDRAKSRAVGIARKLSRSGVRSGPGAGVTAAGPRRESLAPDEIRFDPGSLRSWMRAYNAAVLLSGARVWGRQARSVAEAIAERGVHRAVVTCGPPHMVHAFAWTAARLIGVPFVTDFRDPWGMPRRLVEYDASPLKLWISRRYERAAMAETALAVVSTDTLREAMQQEYPEVRVITVMNGFDEEPLPSVDPPSERFVVRYAGAIYLDRDPTPLLRAAKQVVDRLALEPADFGIEFMGNVNQYGGVTLDEMAAAEGVGAYVTLFPPGSRQEAVHFMAGASMLVSLPQDSPWAIPSKVFEYMRFPSWLLALSDRDTAVGRALEGSTADLASPSDVTRIAEVMEGRIRDFSAGVRPAPVAASCPTFSRRAQASVLFDALEHLTSVSQ